MLKGLSGQLDRKTGQPFLYTSLRCKGDYLSEPPFGNLGDCEKEEKRGARRLMGIMNEEAQSSPCLPRLMSSMVEKVPWTRRVEVEIPCRPQNAHSHLCWADQFSGGEHMRFERQIAPPPCRREKARWGAVRRMPLGVLDGQGSLHGEGGGS